MVWLSPNQELIAFDVDWSEPVVQGINPETSGIPSINYTYASLAAGSAPIPSNLSSEWGVSASSENAFTASLLYVDHGACRLNLPLANVTKVLLDQVDGNIYCYAQQNCCGTIPGIVFNLSCTDNGAQMQADFTGNHSTYDPGLAIQLLYSCNADYVDPFQISANPWVQLLPDSTNGLLQANVVEARVESGNQTLDHQADNAIHALGSRLSNTIQDGFQFQLPNFTQACDASVVASGAAAQGAFCYAAATKEGNGTTPLLSSLFTLEDFTATSDAEAQQQAESAARAVGPSNFSCGGTTPQCLFHPKIQRLYILPDNIEFVLADTTDQDSINLSQAVSNGLNLLVVLKQAPLLAALGVAPSASTGRIELCGSPNQAYQNQFAALPYYQPAPQAWGPPPPLAGTACSSDSDCGSGNVCSTATNICTPASAAAACAKLAPCSCSSGG